MIHGQRATWTERLGKLERHPPTHLCPSLVRTPADGMKRWPSARNYLVLLDKAATPGNYGSNGVWGRDGDDDGD